MTSKFFHIGKKKWVDLVLLIVFCSSIFYVFYEQYLTIWHDVFMNLSISASAIFVMTFILLGFDIISAFIITLTIAM
jgi:Niemann-Pick C1 protein